MFWSGEVRRGVSGAKASSVRIPMSLCCWIVGMTPDRTSRFTCLVTSRSDPGTFFPRLQEPVVPTFQQDMKYIDMKYDLTFLHYQIF
jgi:hypothetical protein